MSRDGARVVLAVARASPRGLERPVFHGAERTGRLVSQCPRTGGIDAHPVARALAPPERVRGGNAVGGL